MGKIYFDHNGGTERTLVVLEIILMTLLVKNFGMEDGSWWITTNQDVKSGEELTWTYTMYKVA